MKLSRRAAVGLVCASLPTLAPAALFESSGPEPVVLTAQSDPGEVFRLLIDDGALLRHVSKAYAGPSAKVAIGGVRVNFITDTGDTARTKEFMGKATVSSSSQMKLVGVSPAQMQAVANRLRDGLRAGLAQRGYQVVDQAQLLELPDFKAAVADTPPVATSSGGSVTTVYAEGTGNLLTFGMRNFAFNQKMPVLLAHVTLNFAAFDKETSRWAAGDKITAGIGSRASSTVAGFVRVMTEDGGGPQFDFVRPLVLPGGFAERIEADDVPAGEKAATVGLRVLGALLGSKDSAADSRFRVVAVKDYESVVGADMALLAGVLSQTLNKRD